jgi:hypothetical protein
MKRELTLKRVGRQWVLSDLLRERAFTSKGEAVDFKQAAEKNPNLWIIFSKEKTCQ